MSKNLYEILGVQSSADVTTIAEAHRSLVEKFLARAERGDEDAANHLKFVNAAFEVLSNPDQRALYDQRLANSRPTPSHRQGAPTDEQRPEQMGSTKDVVGDKERKRGPIALWINAAPRGIRLTAFVGLLTVAAGGVGVWYGIEHAGGSTAGGSGAGSSLFSKRGEPRPGKLASDAYTALKKIESTTESGISYVEYRKRLGDTWFAVKTFLESADAAKTPKFADTLKDAMLAYNYAGTIWEARTQGESSYDRSYAKVSGCGRYAYQKISCERGTRLLDAVPGIEVRGEGDDQYIPLDDAMQKQWKDASSVLVVARGMLR
jgi:curved DNA-binding protein CbpA